MEVLSLVREYRQVVAPVEIEKCQAVAPAGDAARQRFGLLSLHDACTVTKCKGGGGARREWRCQRLCLTGKDNLRLLISPPQWIFAKWELFDLIMDLDSKYQAEAVVQASIADSGKPCSDSL